MTAGTSPDPLGADVIAHITSEAALEASTISIAAAGERVAWVDRAIDIAEAQRENAPETTKPQ